MPSYTYFCRVYVKADDGRTFARNGTITVTDEELAEANQDLIEGDKPESPLAVAMDQFMDDIDEPSWVGDDAVHAVEFELKAKRLS